MNDEPMITLRESREAVGFFSLFFSVVGFGVGVVTALVAFGGACA